MKPTLRADPPDLPCGGVEALRRRGAAPAGDEVLRGHGGEQQHQLQHRGAWQLRHHCAAVTRGRNTGQVDAAGATPQKKF